MEKGLMGERKGNYERKGRRRREMRSGKGGVKRKEH